jgi:uncharacterized membrane protein (UPF0127 family)
MSRRRAKRRLIALCVVLAAGAALAAGIHFARRPDGPARVRIGLTEWRVELALTNDKREKGMGGRTSIPEGTGMLFVFGDEDDRSFYMKDCHVPLDIAFISAGLRIVNIRTMTVEPDPQVPRIYYLSERPAQYVLEVPAGELARAGADIGDRVILMGAARDAVKAAR